MLKKILSIHPPNSLCFPVQTKLQERLEENPRGIHSSHQGGEADSSSSGQGRQVVRFATPTPLDESGLRAVPPLRQEVQPGGGWETHSQVRQLPIQQTQAETNREEIMGVEGELCIT